MNTGIALLSQEERERLIEFCINYGTRLTASTGALLREFNDSILQEAFYELKTDYAIRIKRLRERKQAYIDGKYTPSEAEIAFAGEGDGFIDYMNLLIEQEKSVYKTVTNNYCVYVDTTDYGKKARELHRSLHPKVTFGSSSLLHEEICAELTPERKEYFLNNGIFTGYGVMSFSDINGLTYTDLSIEKDGKPIFYSISHESMAEVDFDEAAERAFIEYREGNDAVLKKLRCGECPEFTVGEKVTVTINSDRVAIQRSTECVLFKGTEHNTKFLFNTGLLGGEYEVNKDGTVHLINSRPTDFVNGQEYAIDNVTLHNGLRGSPSVGINTDGYYASLTVELKAKDGKYCDLIMESDKIFAEVF